MSGEGSKRIFIVEDDPLYVRLIKYVFELNPSNIIHLFSSGQECLDHLHLKPDIISLDYSLPDMNGHEVLKKIRAIDPGIDIILLSGQDDIATAVQLLKDGAYDYIVKDQDTKERLQQTLLKLRRVIALEDEVEQLKEALNERYVSRNNIIGNSKPIMRVIKLIEKAVKTNISISISGETGSGKEVVARSIHYNSDRRDGPFIALNVSAIPKDLLESELFGYEKGAFTGANVQKPGTFELADKGTLFLDEIAEMHISLQAKLLRALQEREIRRIGGTKSIPFDARIIVATHHNLADEVNKGNFREDLYYRLLGLPIEVPPLRERGSDILLLIRHFLTEFCKENQLDHKSISKSGKEKLMAYHYPGNVRELKAIVELAAVMSEGPVIEAEDISFNSPNPTADLLGNEMSLKEYNRKIVDHYLKKYDQDVLLVAQKLDIGKSTIYRMLKESVNNNTL